MQAISAGSGGVAATVSLFPLDTIKTRMQARKASDEGAGTSGGGVAETVVGILEDGGPMAFFAGVGPGAVQSAIEKFVYFYAYTTLKSWFKAVTGDGPGTSSNLVIGYVSEWLHLPVTLPLERVVKTIQTTRKDQQREQKAAAVASGLGGGSEESSEVLMRGGDGGAGPPRASSPGVVATVRTIYQQQGPAGFYRGVVAYVVLCLRPAIQYTVFERLRAILLRGKAKKNPRSPSAAAALSALEAFVLGAVARAIATLVVYPYIRAKVMAQAAAGKAGGSGGCGNATRDETRGSQRPAFIPPSPPLSPSRSSTPNDFTGEQTPTQSPNQRRGVVPTSSDLDGNSREKPTAILVSEPPTMTESLVAVWQSEGIAGIYRGIKPELFRGMLSAAIMLMVKERIYLLNRRLLIGKASA